MLCISLNSVPSTRNETSDAIFMGKYAGCPYAGIHPFSNLHFITSNLGMQFEDGGVQSSKTGIYIFHHFHLMMEPSRRTLQPQYREINVKSSV